MERRGGLGAAKDGIERCVNRSCRSVKARLGRAPDVCTTKQNDSQQSEKCGRVGGGGGCQHRCEEDGAGKNDGTSRWQ